MAFKWARLAVSEVSALGKNKITLCQKSGIIGGPGRVSFKVTVS